MQDAKDHVSMQRATSTRGQGEDGPQAASPTASGSRDPAAGSAASSGSRNGPLASMPGITPEMAEAAADMMRSNPDWYKQVRHI